MDVVTEEKEVLESENVELKGRLDDIISRVEILESERVSWGELIKLEEIK